MAVANPEEDDIDQTKAPLIEHLIESALPHLLRYRIHGGFFLLLYVRAEHL